MEGLVTYLFARRTLDDLFWELSIAVDRKLDLADTENAVRLDDIPGQLKAEDLSAPTRFLAQKRIAEAYTAAVARLVNSVRPNDRERPQVKAVSTRNNFTRRGPKPFPSDSKLRDNVQLSKGHRGSYVNRFLGTFARRGSKLQTHTLGRYLPKLAILAERRVGRPEVPRQWRNYVRKLARGRQLARQRAATVIRRQEKGLNPYPFPRKPVGVEKGWSDWKAAGTGVARLREAVDQARRMNIAHLRALARKQRLKWEHKH